MCATLWLVANCYIGRDRSFCVYIHVYFGGGGSVDRSGYLILNYAFAARLPPRARLWSTNALQTWGCDFGQNNALCPAALAASVWSCLQVFGRSVSLEQAGYLSSGTPLQRARRWRDRQEAPPIELVGTWKSLSPYASNTAFLGLCVCDLPWSHCVRLECALARLLSSFVVHRKLCLLAPHVRVRVRTGFSLEAGK